ncbi:MAG: hypothetical protein Q8O76_02340, partial [Chloroflexota bacterium]|nr:hypothetical protein [Chloroflexota bacterium]
GFMDIPRVIEEALANHRGLAHPSLDEILAADAWAREQALRLTQDSALRQAPSTSSSVALSPSKGRRQDHAWGRVLS